MTQNVTSSHNLYVRTLDATFLPTSTEAVGGYSSTGINGRLLRNAGAKRRRRSELLTDHLIVNLYLRIILDLLTSHTMGNHKFSDLMVYLGRDHSLSKSLTMEKIYLLLRAAEPYH